MHVMQVQKAKGWDVEEMSESDGQGDEQFVRQYWVRAEAVAGKFNGAEQHAISLGNDEYSRHCTPWRPSPRAAWMDAFDFTVLLLEEFRQVEEEIDVQHVMKKGFELATRTSELATQTLRRRYDAIVRTIDRLESIRAELKRGLKEKP